MESSGARGERVFGSQRSRDGRFSPVIRRQLMRTLSFILLVVLTISCSKYRAIEVSSTVTAPKPVCHTEQLATEVREIAAITKGPVGAAFALLGTNESAFIEGQRDRKSTRLNSSHIPL